MFLRVIAALFLVSLARGSNFNQQEQIQQLSNDNGYMHDPLMSRMYPADAMVPGMPIGGYGLANDFGYPGYNYGLRKSVIMPGMAPMYGRAMPPYPIYSDPMIGSPYMGGSMMGDPMLAGSMMGGPMMGGPMVAGPMMGGPMVGGPMVGGAMMGPSVMSPPFVESTFVGTPVLNSPMMAGPMMGGPMMRSPIIGTAVYSQPIALYDENEAE